MNLNDLRIAVTLLSFVAFIGVVALGLVAAQPEPLQRSGSPSLRRRRAERAAMSDFFSSGWSIFIAVATVVSLVACLALLVFAQPQRTQMADDNSTGHVFDEDLVEMNNPMPMWWVVLFVLTVIFAFVYVYAFPALGSVAGSLGWTSRGELEADQAQRRRARWRKVYAAYSGVPAETLSQDAKAMAIGQRLFINNCATCHGSDARGSKGFPNLTDRDWLHGGTPEKIEETITLGRTGVDAADGRGRRHVDRRPQRRPVRAQPLEEPVRLDRRRIQARPSSRPARPATASTARATPPSALPT